LRDSVTFRSWLAQIARRVCWRLKEREALMPLLQLSALEDEGREISDREPSVETKLAARQMKQMLDEAIRKLPEDYRSVYRLRDIEELPGDKVARKLEISRASMKTRLHRARELVRQHLDAVLTSPRRSGGTQ
jgi:RNA polymerase sigma-70 factor, ECF subfamily